MLLVREKTQPGLLALACIVLAGEILAAAACWGEQPAFTVRTDHYVVRTDINETFTTLVSRHMEAILAEYERRLSSIGGEVNKRFEVTVYGNRQDYDGAVPPGAAGSQGAFVPQLKLLVAYLGDRTKEDVLRTLYHEGFHQFLWESGVNDAPIWLNEGLAEYFSEATWNGLSFTTGQLPEVRLRIVQEASRNGTLIPLDMLFSMGSGDWIRHVHLDHSRASVQYNQAWSIVYFLIHVQGGKHQRALSDYLKSSQAALEPVATFEKIFRTTLPSFARAWQSYVMQLRPDAKSRCRRNMELIMALALATSGDPRHFQSLEELRGNLVSRLGSGRVTITRGREKAHLAKEDVLALFKCPEDKTQARISYVLLRRKETGLPVLLCPHHGGIIIGAYYRASPPDGYTVRVEEHVRQTLPADLLKALRRQFRGGLP